LDAPRSRSSAALALALLVPAPSFAILMTMVFFPGPVGMVAWALSKAWILALPLWWTLRVDGERPFRRDGSLRLQRAGLVPGLATGVVAAGVVLLAERSFLRELIEPSALRSMVAANGLDRPGTYAAMAVYTCLVNSLLEEYVWRWFVFRQCARLLPTGLAVLASAAAFTLHHTLILHTQFADPRLTVLGSLAVFAAGALWSGLFARYRSLSSPWASHLLVDVAIFWVGARLIFSGA